MESLHNHIDQQAWRRTASEKFSAMAALDNLRAYLSLCPSYNPSPLINMPDIAGNLGVRRLSIKDETDRMGLGSFKALGGAYAIFDTLLTHAGCPSIDANTIDALRSVGKDMVFCCASAGNHGLSVLAGANLVNAKAVIYLAETVPEDFANRLRAMGAEVRREGVIYDDSMRAAQDACDSNGWTLISDSSWRGYEDIPLKVMQGYSIMSEEIGTSCASKNDWPTHVFLQAGVGGLAGALANHIRLAWPKQPIIIVAEPENAACLMESVRAGALTQVDAPGTNMGRLDCAEASLLAFDILKNTADGFVAIRDDEAQNATNMLAHAHIRTTPSGAAGLAGLAGMVSNMGLREQFEINDNAHCLCFATERALQTKP